MGDGPTKRQEDFDKFVASGGFGTAVNDVCMTLIGTAIQDSGNEPLVAVAAIVTAAARALSMSGLPLGQGLLLFASQFQVMEEASALHKMVMAELPPDGPVDVTPDVADLLNKLKG